MTGLLQYTCTSASSL